METLEPVQSVAERLCPAIDAVTVRRWCSDGLRSGLRLKAVKQTRNMRSMWFTTEPVFLEFLEARKDNDTTCNLGPRIVERDYKFPPFEPCQYAIGSEEKVAVMEARHEAGYPLWHPLDNREFVRVAEKPIENPWWEPEFDEEDKDE